MPIPQEFLERARDRATENWQLWREDFEYRGDVACIPTLQDPYRFCRFCRDYSLMRYRDSHVLEIVRNTLFNSDELRNALHDDSGESLDRFAQLLPQKIPELQIERSLVSKLAAFARPETFVAWDQFACRGAHYLAKSEKHLNAPETNSWHAPKRNSYPYRLYNAYLTDVRVLLNNEVGDQVRGYTRAQSPTTAFILRVLDCFLMDVGGRWRNKD